MDIETADGCALFKRLVETADIVIESFAPGHMDRLGLGYSVLSQINTGIVMTSITPFGKRLVLILITRLPTLGSPL